MAREDDAPLTWSIKQYAAATGISERTARSMLARGEIDGVLRVGSRVLVLRQRVLDQLLRAAGIDPHPEAEADEREAQREAAQAARDDLKATAKGREAYLAMALSRGDELPTDPAVVRG